MDQPDHVTSTIKITNVKLFGRSMVSNLKKNVKSTKNLS